MALADLRSDPVWTDRYERVRDLIERAADAGLVAVYHVGSTAVEDLAGRPALDVIAVYRDGEAMTAAAEALAAEDGYELSHEDESRAVVVRWIEVDEEGREAEFLKLHTPGDEQVRSQLAVRDHLRDHPEARREYEAVKREAAAEHPRGGSEYTAAKSEVVGSLIERAREAGCYDRLPEAVTTTSAAHE